MSGLRTYDCDQRSPEWHELRCGMVTASSVGKLLTSGPPDASTVDCPTCKAGPGLPCLSLTAKKPTPIKSLHDARSAKASEQPAVISVADNETSRGYVLQLVAERITGVSEETPTTFDMWRGIEEEPFAREHYAQYYAPAPVTEVGYMVRTFNDGTKLGLSPDGLVGDDGLLEIKAPRAKGHLTSILSGEVPSYYVPQCQAALLVSGRSWLSFVSWHGGLPLFVKRVEPDPKWFAAITEAVRVFESKAAEMVAAYRKATDGRPLTERVDLNKVELKLA